MGRGGRQPCWGEDGGPSPPAWGQRGLLPPGSVGTKKLVEQELEKQKLLLTLPLFAVAHLAHAFAGHIVALSKKQEKMIVVFDDDIRLRFSLHISSEFAPS